MTSRAEDPDTSVEAAAMIAEYVPRIQNLILRALRHHPRGLSTRQLALNLEIDYATITPRMKPMAEKGWVEMTSDKVKNPHGKGWGHVWRITPAGHGAIL